MRVGHTPVSPLLGRHSRPPLRARLGRRALLGSRSALLLPLMHDIGLADRHRYLPGRALGRGRSCGGR